MRCPNEKLTLSFERNAVSLQHLIHRFAVPLPPLGKANAAAGLVACFPNDMSWRFGGGSMINRRGDSRIARPPERCAASFPRTAGDVGPYKVMSNRIKIRTTNDMPWRFGGRGGYDAAYP